jgi:IS30 family transposase
MGTQYKHLTIKEREMIDVLKRQGNTVDEIANKLRRHKSTISREFNRNASTEYGCYLASRANERAFKRRQSASRRDRIRNPEIRGYVHQKLHEHWSPELIAGRLPVDLKDLKISHETIYQYIYAQPLTKRVDLVQCLARQHRIRRKKMAGRRPKLTKIPNRIPIEQRPAKVKERKQFGHWESDSLISRQSIDALNSLTERKARLLFLTKINRKGAVETSKTIIHRLRRLPPSARRTLTMDNGSENALHESITDQIGTKCFFARPYASYQRGTNERINGLIRRYFPKRTNFAKITAAQVAWVEARINNRPLKCLNFKTPLEVASSCLVALQH